ncbi:cation:proton antiporter [Sphingomonas aracearum]|uniref:Sodium:proton antiporter n=1 Tax=Sphingomonas aracearum TaxID=2283317 RepID=A0A369VVH2_9SPHN|nr:cation:proton antiporter [Sphingomonas aracearum]RDE05170.1 sodium:proton antiporter [Sphingomonas aracearum]
MSFFETLLALLLVAIVLLQVSRRLSLPYPAMLAAAGVAVALVPGVPTIAIDPQTALALFIAPILLDAAFDFPASAVAHLWRPLFALAVLATALTAGCVAVLGWAVAGLPFAAALALGAVVAPPDAAAATAVIANLSLPHRTTAVLKGESLMNDAMALLLFTAAVEVQGHGTIDGRIALELGLAAPGGILLGLGLALIYRPLSRYVAGTLGGNLLQFVNTFWVWILAERLHLSGVLCVVAFGMAIAWRQPEQANPRDRVHSYAVWETVVFLLNVLAFLLMGLQAKVIVFAMPPSRLWNAASFAAMIVPTVIVVRLAWVMAYNRLSARFAVLRGDYEPSSLAQGFLVGWSGMRGLVTVATAFALPQDFPQRDLIVLTAFAVVLATLVLQGITLAPLIRWLRLDQAEDRDREMGEARHALVAAARSALQPAQGEQAETLRRFYAAEGAALDRQEDREARQRFRALGRDAVRAQRRQLEELRHRHAIGEDTYEQLQEELDWRELSLMDAQDRRIEEN